MLGILQNMIAKSTPVQMTIEVNGRFVAQANLICDSEATLGQLLTAGASYCLETQELEDNELEHGVIHVRYIGFKSR